MNIAYSEILRLKALLIFRNAFSKPYEQWTEEEAHACSLLDAIWRSEHGYAEKPDLDDPLHKKAMDSLFRHINGKATLKWSEETLKLASRINYVGSREEYGVLVRVYDRLCSLWDSFRKKLGFGKKDDISPFEAVRTLKILKCPEFNSLFLLNNELRRANEMVPGDIAPKIPEGEYVPEHIRLKYEVLLSQAESGTKPIAEKNREIANIRNAFATEMTAVNPLHPAAFDLIYQSRESSLIIYTRAFIGAIDKPYHQWSKTERDACSVLDAIWRKDRGMDVLVDADAVSHWHALNKKLSSFSLQEQKKLKDELLKCGKNAVGSDRDEAMTVAYARIGNTCGKFFGGKEFSPFEAMRMLKIVNDPQIDMEHAVNEIRNYARGQASGSQAMSLSGVVPSEGKEKLFGDVPYHDLESPAFFSWSKGAFRSDVEPVDIRMTGANGDVHVRCMSNEKSVIMDAFLLAMGHENVTANQCDNIATGILRALRNTGGVFDATLKEGEKLLGQAICRQGEENIRYALQEEAAPPAAQEKEEQPELPQVTDAMLYDESGWYDGEDASPGYPMA